MSNNLIQATIEKLTTIFLSVEEELNNWQGDGNLQLPKLIQTVATKSNWSEKEMRDNDPLIRFFCRNHPDWHISRGAKGGLMKISEKERKDAARQNKSIIKAELKSIIESSDRSSNHDLSQE